MPLEMTDQFDASNDPSSRRKLYWIGCFALIGAIAVIGFNMWR
jgi:hypothetical protein